MHMSYIPMMITHGHGVHFKKLMKKKVINPLEF